MIYRYTLYANGFSKKIENKRVKLPPETTLALMTPEAQREKGALRK